MGGWGVLVYLAVGTTGGLVFLSIVADDVRRVRGAQDVRKAALDRQRAKVAHDQAVIDEREAAKIRRAERYEKAIATPTESDPSPENNPASEH